MCIMKNIETRFFQIIMKCQEQYSENILPELEDLLISEERISKMENVMKTNPDEETIIKIIREIKKTESLS